MRISVKAKPGSREESVEKIDDANYIVSVKEPPVEGRANLAIIKALAAYFRVDALRVIIVSGHRAKNKQIEIRI